MSVDLRFYIECRDKNGKWHNVKWFSNRYFMEEDNEDESDNEVFRKGFLTKRRMLGGLSLRDELSWHGDYGTNFLPDDISEELSNELEIKAREDEEYYKKIYGDSFDKYHNKDYRLKYSCITLSELYKITDKKRSEWKESVMSAIERMKDNDINRNLIDIKNFLSGKISEFKNTDENSTDYEIVPYEDSLDYYLGEELSDLFELESDIDTIHTTVKNYLGYRWFNTEDVRIIYYLD